MESFQIFKETLTRKQTRKNGKTRLNSLKSQYKNEDF